MSAGNVVEIKDVVKDYGERRVVDRLSLEIRAGECFGLLGPNGAGKTTTMKMMYGSALITSGEMYVLGLNVRTHPREVKSRIGVVPQEDGLDPDFSVLENLLVYSGYHGLSPQEAEVRARDLLRMMKLEEHAGRPVEELSGGMKRRLVIARALMNKPDLLFLDEPTTGLDPQSRVWIWDFFRELKRQKSSVVLTTHYMEEAERMCDRVALMDGGRILTIGSPQAMISSEIGREVVEFETNPGDMSYYLQRLNEKGFEYQVIHQTVAVLVGKDQESKDAVALVSSDRITVRKPTLNDVFLKLAGHHLRDE